MINYKLKDLLTIHNGKKYSHLNEGDIPVFGSGGLMCYVNNYLHDGEAILLPRKGTLNNIMFQRSRFWTVDTMYYSTVIESINAYYLYYYLKLLDLSKLDSGSTLPSMTKSAYYNIPIRLPSFKKQNLVAQLLKNLDDKIELNQKINDELESMAKLIYDYWFVQFDFPDENGKPYKSSGGKMVYNEELKQEIPMGWTISKINEISNLQRGQLITKSSAKENGDVKVVSAGVKYSFKHNEWNREANTITISSSGANAGYINFWREKIFACDCITVNADNIGLTLFLFYFLSNRQEFIFRQAKGSAQPHVYPSDIAGLLCAMPPESLMKKFENFVNPLNKQIGNLFFESEKLEKLRDWLLPMLMNGQVTIKD